MSELNNNKLELYDKHSHSQYENTQLIYRNLDQALSTNVNESDLSERYNMKQISLQAEIYRNGGLDSLRRV